MGNAAEAHVALAHRVVAAMEAFARARRLEAAAVGAALPPDPTELTAGLILGFVRAYRRIDGLERQVAPKTLRYLGRTMTEYARAVSRLESEFGNEAIAIWADLAEAVTEAARRSDDEMAAMLEFATLVRRYGVLDYDHSANDDAMDAPGHAQAQRGASTRVRRLH